MADFRLDLWTDYQENRIIEVLEEVERIPPSKPLYLLVIEICEILDAYLPRDCDELDYKRRVAPQWAQIYKKWLDYMPDGGDYPDVKHTISLSTELCAYSRAGLLDLSCQVTEEPSDVTEEVSKEDGFQELNNSQDGSEYCPVDKRSGPNDAERVANSDSQLEHCLDGAECARSAGSVNPLDPGKADLHKEEFCWLDKVFEYPQQEVPEMTREILSALEDLVIVFRLKLPRAYSGVQIKEILQMIEKIPPNEPYYLLVNEVFSMIVEYCPAGFEKEITSWAIQLENRWRQFADTLDPNKANPWLICGVGNYPELLTKPVHRLPHDQPKVRGDLEESGYLTDVLENQDVLPKEFSFEEFYLEDSFEELCHMQEETEEGLSVQVFSTCQLKPEREHAGLAGSVCLQETGKADIHEEGADGADRAGITGSDSHHGHYEQSTLEGSINQSLHRLTEHQLSTGCYHKAPDWAPEMPQLTDQPSRQTPATTKTVLDWKTRMMQKRQAWKDKFKDFLMPDLSLVPPNLPKPPD